MNGELVGVWNTRASASEFQYDNAWLQSDRTRPLSLSLPILPNNGPHRGDYVDAWFDNLLPESKEIRQRIQKNFRTPSVNTFDLLSAIGRDCVGAVQLLETNKDPGDIRQIEARELSDAEVAKALRAATSLRTFGYPEEEFRISIAGAQEKTALLRLDGRWYVPHGATPTTHILKLPLGLIGNLQADMKDSVENEWLCLEFLNELGLPVAHTEIARFEDNIGELKALVVTRFDREFVGPESTKTNSWILRLPQEDMCQASGTPPEHKYESDGGPGIREILGLLQAGLESERDTVAFAKAQLAFWLLAAPDGHAKNFSIFLKRDGYNLTPLYDVLSAWPIIGRGPTEWAYQKAKLAMAVRGTRPYRHFKKISVRHWENLATETGVVGAFDEMVSMVEDSERALIKLEGKLPSNFPEPVWEKVFAGVRDHRERFLSSLRVNMAET